MVPDPDARRIIDRADAVLESQRDRRECVPPAEWPAWTDERWTISDAAETDAELVELEREAAIAAWYRHRERFAEWLDSQGGAR